MPELLGNGGLKTDPFGLNAGLINLDRPFDWVAPVSLFLNGSNDRDACVGRPNLHSVAFRDWEGGGSAHCPGHPRLQADVPLSRISSM